MSKQDKKPYNQLNLLTRKNSTDDTDGMKYVVVGMMIQILFVLNITMKS